MDEVINGYRFRDPAPQTIKFMEEQTKFNQHFELGMNDMKNSIKSIVEKLEQNTEEHKQIMDKMDKFLGGCDNKYASKNVEKILLWAGAIIGAGILGAILKTVLK